MQKILSLLFFSFTLILPATSSAQEYKGLIGGGFGYNTNLLELKTTGLSLVGELPFKRGSSYYFNFHWSMGFVKYGDFYTQSNLLAVATFESMSEDEHYSYMAGQTAGLLAIIPTGVTYYFIDSLPSRFGFYLNPLNGEYFDFGDGKDVVTYAPEIGIKYMHWLYRKTFFYFSGGCAYNFAIETGLFDSQSKEYQDGIFLKLTAGLVFYGTSDNKQGASKPKN
jgi:hypothetical protein